MKRLLIILVLFVVPVILYSQGEIDEQQKVFFRNERSLGILLNTDGIGLSFRAGKRLNYLNKRIIEIDAGSLRDPKEYKQRPASYQGGSYVFGKMNSAFFLRGGYGRQHEMFSKEDFGGIAIRYFWSLGPVISLYKPIYYRMAFPLPHGAWEFKDLKFDPSFAVPSDIYSKAAFTKGLDETKVMPGAYGKLGFNFEYSKEDKIIHAVELGAQINGFIDEIPIMATQNNKSIFFSLFVSYRFGIIVDPLHPESKGFLRLFNRKKE